jgi:hypothetical protein
VSGPNIPLADAPRLRPQARRTLIVRVVLGALAVASLVAAIAVSRNAVGAQRTFFSDARSSVVVIDISGSIGPVERSIIGRTLTRLLAAHDSFGVVFFSDSAYEAVPPGTRWTEIEPLLRYFQPQNPQEAQSPNSPWSEFRGGTRISAGLQLAREIVTRGSSGSAGVLLLSDLNDSIFDAAALTQTLAGYVNDHISLRVIGLQASAQNEEVFKRVLGPHAIVSDAELPSATGGPRAAVVTASVGSSTWLVLAALVLLLALGLHEQWVARLRWKEATA